MIIGVKVKDPVDIRIYEIDWTDWLEGWAITTSTWYVPPGLTNISDSKTDTATQIMITGGTVNNRYNVCNTIWTNNGESKKVSFDILVEDQ